MKNMLLTAASGLILSSFLIASTAVAQGERVDANGMPTTHSTPAEQAETARINNQIGVTDKAPDAAASAQADANNAQYQAQQQQYQNQLQQNQAAQQNYQAAKDDYEARNRAYYDLRARFAAERAAYRRGVWPSSSSP